MDQESCNTNVPYPGSCRGPLVGRRRSLALATAAVLASSASRTAAFSPSSSAASTRQYPYRDESTKRGRSSHRRSLNLNVLNVSFMEAPTTTTTANNIQPRKRRGSSRATARIRKGPAKGGSRTIEIELQPDYDLLGLDDFVTTSQQSGSPTSKKQPNMPQNSNGGLASTHIVPDIDSEILYEGITSAREPVSQKQIESKGAQKSAATANKPAANKGQSTKIKSSAKKSSPPATDSPKKSRSSTMPGFIKDEDLDLHIANLGLKRLPTSQRKLTRMVRSKSAKLKRRQTNSEMLYKKSSAVPDSLLDYAQEIHAISRVSPKEEKELGTKTQEAIRLQRLHDDLEEKYGREPSDDEWCAAAGKLNIVALQEAIEDGMEAKNQLVASNLRMVQRVVNLYIRNGLGSEYNAGDLMQDGTMALIRAAEKYEPDRGFRFSTYAMYWIRSAVKRSQTSQSRIVTVPQRIHETHKRVTKQEAQLRKELGREATKEELALACGISVTQLDRCRKAMGQVTLSLDAELENGLKPNSGSSRKDTMYDIVTGQVDETEYERTQRLLMKEHLIGTLRRYLSPHEVDLLLLRYGLMDDRALPKGMSGPLTIAEVSKLVGLKPDKVRRIIINSQKQLKCLMKEWEDFEFELA